MEPIEIYALLREYDIVPTTPEEHNVPILTLKMTQGVLEEVVRHVNDTSGSNNAKRKTKVPAHGIKLISLESGEKLPVEFDEDQQAIGENSIDFVWFLEQIVRNRSCCPLQVKERKEIEEHKIEHMWNIILEKFNFDVSDRKGTIVGHMNSLCRDYRHKMKKRYFDAKITFQNRIRSKPKHVQVDDWKYLVNF
ncbi:hypothetical protein GH714_021348 [Hevea brasiliensis]|uniref:Myb/SANT-like domain-containing protein n=1 Tax=Hevea brasiliensis TaxID=3981 RepID=A0A6A6LDA9_HEVBR|nr:hypothetical protein GH714_021348 [Hevea brasiliensis]